MFQFSLFSSFIPYLVLAIMYVVYFGMYSYNKLTADKEQVYPEQAKKKTITADNQSSQKTIQLSEHLFFADDLIAEAFSDELQTAPSSAIHLKWPVSADKQWVSSCLCFKLFSRPPPHIS